MKKHFDSPINYSGCRSNGLREAVFSILPEGKVKRFVDPFAGSGVFTFHAMINNYASEYAMNDKCSEMVRFWELVRTNPENVKNSYRDYLSGFLDKDKADKKAYYEELKVIFNTSTDINYKALLYVFLINTSKDGQRYNGNQFVSEPNLDGDILSSEEFGKRIDTASELLRKNKVDITCDDFTKVLEGITKEDAVVLDPPYPGDYTTTLYVRHEHAGLLQEKLAAATQKLKEGNVPFTMQYGVIYFEGQDIQEDLGMPHLDRYCRRSMVQDYNPIIGDFIENIFTNQSQTNRWDPKIIRYSDLQTIKIKGNNMSTIQAYNNLNSTRPIGKTGLEVFPIGYGCLQYAYFGDDEAQRAIAEERAKNLICQAYEQGVRFFATAEAYGPDNQRLLAEGLDKIGVKDKVVISTKLGIDLMAQDSHFTQSRENVRASVENNLNLLGVSKLQLLSLHRLDTSIITDIDGKQKPAWEAALEEMLKLKEEGKIEHIGLSEANADQIRRAYQITPISTIEIAYSPFTRRAEINGVKKACDELGITIIAYASAVKGFANGELNKQIRAEDFALPNDEFRKKIFKVAFNIDDVESDERSRGEYFSLENIKATTKAMLDFQTIAERENVSPVQLSLAWTASKGIIPIPGTSNSANLTNNNASFSLLTTLTPSVFAEIDSLLPPERFGALNPNPTDKEYTGLDADGLKVSSSPAAAAISPAGVASSWQQQLASKNIARNV